MDTQINPISSRFRTFGQVDRFQEGQGFVDGFVNIFKRIVPYLKTAFTKVAPVVSKIAKNKIVKNTVQELGDHAVKAGINATTTALAGENVSESLKKDLKDAGNIGMKGLNKLAASYSSRKRPPAKSFPPTNNKRRKKQRKDLFT